MTSITTQTPPRKRSFLFKAVVGVGSVFLVLILIGALLPDEPNFEVSGFGSCKNDWFRREINRRLLGATIYKMNPYGGDVQKGILVCVAFPETSIGNRTLTYNFEWIDKAKGKWDLKFF